THPPLLDHCDAETGRRAVQRGRVATGASAEHDDVELLGQDGHLLSSPGLCLAAVILSGIATILRPSWRSQRARRIWMAEAARIAKPVIAASRMSVRGLIRTSSCPCGPRATGA